MAYILMPAPIIHSISISPFENPILSFPPSSKIRWKPAPSGAGAFKRSRQSPPSPCRDPPKDDMSVVVPMSQMDVDDESLPNSRSSNDREGMVSYTTAHRKKYYPSTIKIFGVDLSPDNVAVAMVYFVQGVLGLARLAVSFYLKDDLHLDPAETAVVSGFSAFPWLVKPLYGFISDSVPLFGYRRRSYLILSGLLGALSWTLMATLVDSKYGAAFCILLGSLSVAFSDVTFVILRLQNSLK